MPPIDIRASCRKYLSLLSTYISQLCRLYVLACENAIPGVDTSRNSLFDRYGTFVWNALKLHSIKPNTWSAPFREMALDRYKRLNTAIAQYVLMQTYNSFPI